MARGYSVGNFGDAYFGTTKYVDAAAVVSASSSVTSGGLIVKDGLSAIDGAASVTASANYTSNAASVATNTSSVSAIGVRVGLSAVIVQPVSVVVTGAVIVKDSSASLAGTSTVIGGIPVVTAGGHGDVISTSTLSSRGEVIKLGLISDTAAASLTSVGLIVKDGLVSDSATASTSATCERIQIPAIPSIDGSSVVDVNAYYTAYGSSGSGTFVSTVASAGEIIYIGGAVIESQSTTSSNATLKYEPIAKDNETWAVVPQGNEIWTEVA